MGSKLNSPSIKDKIVELDLLSSCSSAIRDRHEEIHSNLRLWFTRVQHKSPPSYQIGESLALDSKDMSTDGARSSLKTSFDRFEELILRHAVDRPPWTTGILSAKDVGAITDYVSTRRVPAFDAYVCHI